MALANIYFLSLWFATSDKYCGLQEACPIQANKNPSLPSLRAVNRACSNSWKESCSGRQIMLKQVCAVGNRPLPAPAAAEEI